MTVDKKKCPFCAEEINIDAIKCKHCGEFLNQINSQNEGTSSSWWITITFFLCVLTFIMGFTNPSEEKHYTALKQQIVNELNVNSDPLSSLFSLALNFTDDKEFSRLAKQIVKVKDYLIFSTSSIKISGKEEVVGIGVFGKIFLLNKETKKESGTKTAKTNAELPIEYRNLIGKEYIYQDFTKFDELKGYKRVYNKVIGKDGYSYGDYYIRTFGKNSKILIVLEKVVGKSNEENKYSLIDILEINELGKYQYVSENCRLNKKSDAEVIAVYKAEDLNVKYYSNILKAWRANEKTGKIEQIDTKGIECINDEYGVTHYQDEFKQ
jgi:hypothetical protein